MRKLAYVAAVAVAAGAAGWLALGGPGKESERGPASDLERELSEEKGPMLQGSGTERAGTEYQERTKRGARDDPTAGGPDYLQQALEKAGANRGELERVLQHFQGDPQKLRSARHLIENMIGKSYQPVVLTDKDGDEVTFDPFNYETAKEAHEALQLLAKKYEGLGFKKGEEQKDLEKITSKYLINHINEMHEVWEETPEGRRPTYEQFLEDILPHRVGNEEVESWVEPLRFEYRDVIHLENSEAVWLGLNGDKDGRVRNEIRWDQRQGMDPGPQTVREMLRRRSGNDRSRATLQVKAARAAGLPATIDYVTAWPHEAGSRNWAVSPGLEHLVDSPGYPDRAVKVWREQYDGPDEDVTHLYGPVTNLTANTGVKGGKAHLMVFNAGQWKSVQETTTSSAGQATFRNVGTGALVMPAVETEKGLVMSSAPIIIADDGNVTLLDGNGKTGPVTVDRTTTFADPNRAKALAPGGYKLLEWVVGKGWQERGTFGSREGEGFEAQGKTDGLYVTVPEGKNIGAARPFVIRNGQQQFW